MKSESKFIFYLLMIAFSQIMPYYEVLWGAMRLDPPPSHVSMGLVVCYGGYVFYGALSGAIWQLCVFLMLWRTDYTKAPTDAPLLFSHSSTT
jgi:hypothetical protein